MKQVAIGQVDASSISLNELQNVDTTTETLQSGTTLIFDATTNKFEAANNTQIEQGMRKVADRGATLIVAMGFAQSAAVAAMAQLSRSNPPSSPFSSAVGN